MKVKILLVGCDDTTDWVQEVTLEQYNFLKEIQEKSNELSTCGCMPILRVCVC